MFINNNEAPISHTDFISSIEQVVGGYYPENITNIRVSHPIRGRIPEARYKKASELQPHEETLYYERMMSIGSCRMYQYMPKSEKLGLPKLEFGDSQINQVVDGYYNDDNFSRESDGSINLWNLYNLFTGANKSSYIDRFLERSVNAGDVIRNLATAL